MKIWLDDVRRPPPGWMWVKTATEAILFLNTDKVKEISLDHDLGDDEPNGYVVATFIEERAYDGRISPLRWSVHSDNPVGAARMRLALKNADRYWSETNGQAD